MEPTLASLCVERVDRQVDSIEVKNIVCTIEAGVNNETKMETTENIGIESPTLSTCGLFDELGKMNFENFIYFTYIAWIHWKTYKESVAIMLKT